MGKRKRKTATRGGGWHNTPSKCLADIKGYGSSFASLARGEGREGTEV